MGHVEMSDGTSLHIAAIQVSNIGRGGAYSVIEEMNAMLRDRRGSNDP